jgi:predicted TIM-barrel enzyme
MINNHREMILSRLRKKISSGRPVIGGGAGTGISAKCEEEGGIDLIVIYNSGKYRMAGKGSLAGLLAYGNANQIVVELAHEVLTTVTRTPVLAGVCGTDPFILRDNFLRELKQMGFCGIQNFPTVGIIDGDFRNNLEETGMSYQMEVELIEAAHSIDLLTAPYVFNVEEAVQMTKVGADIVVAHMGLTSKGRNGAKTTKPLDECAELIQQIIDACKNRRKNTLVLCHGGPISTPEDTKFILEKCRNLDGFFGASSMERLPTEVSITEQVKRFGELRIKQSTAD